MKKFSKTGAPPARKTAGGPKRSFGARSGGDDAKRPYSPQSPRSPRPPRDGDAPRRPYSPRGDDAAPPRRSFSRDAGEGGARSSGSAYGDPYKRAQRPPRSYGDAEGSEGARRPAGRGFTVTLDPDVARVFRGDASVNKALRLVLQLMQVIEGPGPRGDRPAPRPRSGYQGSDEARGFSRKPRFVEDDGDSDSE